MLDLRFIAILCSFCFISVTAQDSPLCVTNPSSSSVAKCSVSADDLVTGRSVAGSSANNGIPPWLNLTLAQQGQTFGRNNFVSSGFSFLYGLMGVIAIPDIQDVLFFTNNSASVITAIKRYVATGTQITVWLNDLLSTDLSNNAFLTSLANVRQIHLAAAAKATAHGSPLNDQTALNAIPTDDVFWTAFAADLQASDIPASSRSFSTNYHTFDGSTVPINQFTQAVTQFGFLGYLTLDPESIYIYDATDEQLKGFIHLWAVIGYAIGIDDNFNICLKPDVATAKAHFKEIHEKYYLPSFFNLKTEGKILIEAVLWALHQYLPGLELRFFLRNYLRDIVGIPTPNINGILTPQEASAALAYDTLFVPATHAPGFQQGGTTTAGAALQTTIVALYGPYFTNMDKAKYVFYNGSSSILPPYLPPVTAVPILPIIG